MTLQTNSQKMAQKAYERIQGRRPNREFTSFTREFPSLVHSCGLAQAVAFAKAKKKHQSDYLADLAAVLVAAGHANVSTVDELERAVRNLPVTAYVRLSRHALQAAGWLKRYVEAAEEA